MYNTQNHNFVFFVVTQTFVVQVQVLVSIAGGVEKKKNS